MPRLSEFNWALDYFDVMAAGNDATALWIVEESGEERQFSFATLAKRSNQVANWLREQGVRRGDRVLVMLGNEVALWETVLAAIKLGAVVVPATNLLTRDDLRDRLARGAGPNVVGKVIFEAAATEGIRFGKDESFFEPDSFVARVRDHEQSMGVPHLTLVPGLDKGK